jgi:hypothetical protein
MPTQLRAVCTVAVGVLLASCGPRSELASAAPAGAPPRLDPDYTSLVIPPNIAPLNFRIQESGRDFVVRVSSDAAPLVELRCPDGTCRFDAPWWRELLDRNRGQRLYWDVYAQHEDGTWVRFDRVTNAVAEEPIDAYIVYRQLAPNSQFTSIKGIFQRSLESFACSPLVTLRNGTFECVNCHTFHQNNPNRFLFHIRRKHAGMMLYLDGVMRKVDTKQGPMFRPLAYASWHPDGRHIAATLNMYVGNSPSTVEGYYFQAIEKRGDLAVYDVETNRISTTSAVFGNEYIETHPYWSYDGRYIYFARCKDMPLLSHQDLDKFKFDLMRISYDTATETWGEPETVVAYSQVGKSCAFPRPSPDGRYVLHILSDKGTYPIYQRNSDVYLLDLTSLEYRRLDAVSSDFAESFPRWSSNGRWFSFLSNRNDGRSALPYFAYLDAAGEAHKAFVLPQEDPAYYDSFTDSYNVLELVKSRVEADPFELAQAMQLPAQKAEFPNPPDVDAVTRATWEYLAGQAEEAPSR